MLGGERNRGCIQVAVLLRRQAQRRKSQEQSVLCASGGTFSSVKCGRVRACMKPFGFRAFSSEGSWSNLEGAQNLCVAEVLILCSSGVVAKAWQL